MLPLPAQHQRDNKNPPFQNGGGFFANYSARPCLKHVKQPRQRVFSRHTAQYTKYCCVKSPCLAKEFLAVGHTSNSQTRSRIDRTVAGEPPNRPSGRRRGCAVRAFCRRQNLGAGAALPPRALKSRRAERAFGPRSPQKRTRPMSCPFLWCARRESNPHALASTGT